MSNGILITYVTQQDVIMERTLVIIKPNKQGLLDEITARLIAKGLHLVAVKTVQDTDNSKSLGEVNTGPVTALVFQGVGAIDQTRISLGDISVSHFQRSENQEAAEKEIPMWFTEEEIAPSNVNQIEVVSSPDHQKERSINSWHDLFTKCPHIAEDIFAQMNLEEILQLQEVCVDWRKAVEESTKVQDRLSKVTLHKAAVQGWMRVAKILLARGDDPNRRIVCDDCVPHEHFPGWGKSRMALSWTALHGAVALGRKEMTQLLLSKGADTSSKLRLFVFYDEPPNQGPLVEPHTHEVTAIQLSRMPYDWPVNWKTLDKSGYPYLGYPEGQLLQRNLRGVEEILMQNCANEAERNIGVPVCETCFGAGVNGTGVTRVSLPELLWVFRDFPKRMDHLANDGEDGIPWNVYRCPVRRFNLE